MFGFGDKIYDMACVIHVQIFLCENNCSILFVQMQIFVEYLQYYIQLHPYNFIHIHLTYFF